MHERPANEEELQKREVVGVIRASRFVRTYAKAHEPITVNTVCHIHKEIFQEVWPEMAGVYRQEPIKITGSRHDPPHHSDVPRLMHEVDQRLIEYAQGLKQAEGVALEYNDMSEERFKVLEEIVRFAAYLHHAITFIHPFRDGNGRTARLAANLVLERYGLIGISIKVEKENKNRYCSALAQADEHQDYDPLIELIVEGLVERYEGVAMKFTK